MIETSTIWEIMIKLIPGNSKESGGTPRNSGEIPKRFRGDSEEVPKDSEEFRRNPGNSEESTKSEKYKNMFARSSNDNLKWNPSTFGLNVQIYSTPKRTIWILIDSDDFKP